MTEKSEALRLAEQSIRAGELVEAHEQADPTDPGHDVNVLREHVRHLERRVRELHAENAALRQANEAFGRRQEWWTEKMFTLEQRRDALLEVLCRIAMAAEATVCNQEWVAKTARAAIKAVEGE